MRSRSIALKGFATILSLASTRRDRVGVLSISDRDRLMTLPESPGIET